MDRWMQINEMKLNLFHCRTNVNELAATIAADEPLITAGVIPQLIESLSKLQTKISDASNHQFYKTKTLKTHLLPLTNVAFDKRGKRYILSQFFITWVTAISVVYVWGMGVHFLASLISRFYHSAYFCVHC